MLVETGRVNSPPVSDKFSESKCCAENRTFKNRARIRLTYGMHKFRRVCATIASIGDSMPINSVIPSPIFETLRDSEDTLRTTLAELAEDKRKQKPNISDRKLAEYLADQMGYRGAKNVEALVASRERILKSRQAVGLSK